MARENDEDLYRKRNVTLKEDYAAAVDKFREDQLVPPGRTEVVYRAIDRFLEEHGYEPVEDY